MNVWTLFAPAVELTRLRARRPAHQPDAIIGNTTERGAPCQLMARNGHPNALSRNLL